MQGEVVSVRHDRDRFPGERLGLGVLAVRREDPGLDLPAASLRRKVVT